VPPGNAKYMMRTNTTAAAAMMVACGDADALISGVAGKLSMDSELELLQEIMGLQRGVTSVRLYKLNEVHP
jgi:phosphotransacetylase